MMKNKGTAFLLLLTLLLLSFSSCEKEESNTPRTEVPDEAVGAWQFGTASFTEIWNGNDNSYLGNAFELSVRFDLKKNGTYEQYFVAGSQQMGGCRINVFNVESGTVTFDAASHTFTTHPVKVRNRSYNCGEVTNSEKTKNLKSNTYAWNRATAPSGTPVLELKVNDALNFSTFYKQ